MSTNSQDDPTIVNVKARGAQIATEIVECAAKRLDQRTAQGFDKYDMQPANVAEVTISLGVITSRLGDALARIEALEKRVERLEKGAGQIW